ncbi:MAG: hypothetical protein R2822_02050 [Spirosomataceae bacterium]
MKKYLQNTSKIGLILGVMLTGGQPSWSQNFARAQNLPPKHIEVAPVTSPRLLKDVLNILKDNYKIDIMFERKVVEGLTVS